MRETLDLCKQAGLKTIAYVPLNHPFMDASSKDPRYAEWRKVDAKGAPMTTEHYGYARYFEGCLNSPSAKLSARSSAKCSLSTRST